MLALQIESQSPVIVRRQLACGLTVLVETIPWVRSVALGYYLRTGSAIETLDNAGASHFLEHLVFRGTENRTLPEIARIIDMLGGDVDAFTGKEYASFYAHVLDEQVDMALDLLTDVVLRPRFDDEGVEMERSVVLEEIRMVEDTPDDVIHEVFLDAFWPGHPLGRPILGTEESVNRLQRTEITSHYAATFHPANMLFVASGNVDPDHLIEYLERAFERQISRPMHGTWTTPVPSRHVVVRHKRELEQIHVCLGTRGLPQESPKRYVAALFNTILGGGMSSRLFQRVRENEGLVYSISSYHTGFLHGGYEMIYAACNPKNVGRVLDSTLQELRRIRVEGVTAEELVNAKLCVKGSILLSLESTVSRMSGMARQEYYYGRQFTPDEIIANVNAVSADDILEVAQTILDPDSLSLTLLGNARKPYPSIESLASALV